MEGIVLGVYKKREKIKISGLKISKLIHVCVCHPLVVLHCASILNIIILQWLIRSFFSIIADDECFSGQTISSFC